MPRLPGLEFEGAVYHVMARGNHRGNIVFSDADRRVFANTLDEVATKTEWEFSAWTLMDNHLLLEEPGRELLPKLTKQELIEKLPYLYDEDQIRTVANEFEHAETLGDNRRRDQILERYEKRMANVSVFMKELKQRFTQWYNRRNQRTGTLWESRYHSVLVEDDPRALMVMSAYIDLNPVRTGIVDRVEDYRWCCTPRADTELP